MASHHVVGGAFPRKSGPSDTLPLLSTARTRNPFPPIPTSKIPTAQRAPAQSTSGNGESSGAEQMVAEAGEEYGGCETPKRREYRIPAVPPCPPPPRKKPAGSGRRRDPPKNGYFTPPDLEALFALAPRREASYA